MPVGLPNPNRSIQAASSPGPSFSAIVIVPTFDDWARMSLTLITSVPRVCASWITRSATWIVGASVKVLVGETTLSSSAPAIVTILNVEPGS